MKSNDAAIHVQKVAVSTIVINTSHSVLFSVAGMMRGYKRFRRGISSAVAGYLLWVVLT